MSSDRDEVLDQLLSDTVDKKTQEMKEPNRFKPGVGLDIGTSFIVVSRQTENGEFIHKYHRNMLYPIDISDESTDMLENGSYLYVKSNNKYYVVGESALSICLAMGQGEVIRPMSLGVLSPQINNATELIFLIIKSVLGEPLIPNEPLRVSIPANAVDVNIDNLFHKIVLTTFLKKLGYDAKVSNEAMCVAYSCNPSVLTEEGNIIPLSGIAISMGAGQTNVALLFRGMELASFSISKSGDYIDEMASKATGVAKSKIVKKKEKELELNIDNSKDRILSALDIYYHEYVNRIIYHIKNEFISRKSEIDGKSEIVIAGGTSMPKGLINLFENEILSCKDFPLFISKVTHSKNPFYAVSEGACIKAISDYVKSIKR